MSSSGGAILCSTTLYSASRISSISRPLNGENPTIDLVVGYHKANTSPILNSKNFPLQNGPAKLMAVFAFVSLVEVGPDILKLCVFPMAPAGNAILSS